MFIENNIPIIRAIRNLASSAEKQKSYLINLGTFPLADELAIEFDDAYETFKGNLNKHKFNKIEKSILFKIDRMNVLLDSLTNCKTEHDIWNIKSLNCREWNTIRDLAIKILSEANLSSDLEK